jgi:DNA polymerase-3 subunit delta'
MVREAFADILGQSTAVDLLCQAILDQRIAPAYLFSGPVGVGRRKTALRFAECLLSSDGASPVSNLRRRIETQNHPDLLWVEPTYLHKGKPITVAEAEALDVKRKSPPQIRLEQIRGIIQFLARPPLEAARSSVIIEGAETMAEPAANGLLKTLEEPGNATVILLAAEGHQLLSTIVSRCQTIPFRRLSQSVLTTILQPTDYAELLQQPSLLAMAQGSPGQAIATYQHCQTIAPELIDALQQPPSTLRTALELARRISKELNTESQLWLVSYLQQLSWHHQQSSRALEVLERAHFQLRRFVQPRLVWEVTLMSLIEA